MTKKMNELNGIKAIGLKPQKLSLKRQKLLLKVTKEANKRIMSNKNVYERSNANSNQYKTR